MIIPTRRLVLWAILLGLPFGTLLGIGNVDTAPVILVLLVFVGGGVIDVLVPLKRSHDVSMAWSDEVSLTVGQKSTFALHLKGNVPQRLRLVIQASEHLEFHPAEQHLHLPLEGGVFHWEVEGLKRGKAWIETLWVAKLSPLGLWEHQDKKLLNLPVRVLPNLERGSGALSEIFRQLSSGLHHAPHLGQGQEFDRLRLYQRGDHWGDIDWKATARRQYPVTRQYRVERSQKVVVFLDASRASARELPHSPDEEPLVLDALVKVALCIVRVVEAKGDNAGLLIYDHQVRNYMAPARGRDHQSRLMNILYDVQPGPLPARASEICAKAKTLLPKRSLIIFLGQSRERSSRENTLKSLPILARDHHLIMAELTDPFEHAPFDGEDLKSELDLYEHFQGYLNHLEHRAFGLELRQRGISFLSLPVENYAMGILRHYLQLKSRSVL